VVFWNCANGAVAKFDFIEQVISDSKPDILFVSEAEIKTGRNYDCLSVSGYEIEVSQTLLEGSARQIAYVKQGCGFKRLKNLENGTSEVLVFWRNGLRVCGVYRPFKNIKEKTSTQAFASLVKNLEVIAATPDDVIIGGDFNVNWKSRSNMKRKLVEWSESHGLVQGIDKMTRHRAVKSSVDGELVLQESCIDLVFQRLPRKIIINSSISSDHDIIQVILNKRRPCVTKKIWTVDWRRYNKNDAMSKLAQNIIQRPSTTPRDEFDNVTSAIIETLNAVAPKRVMKLRNESEFENSKIAFVKKKRDRAFKNFKKTGDPKYLKKSKQLSKKLKAVVKKERKRVFRRKLECHGQKSFWKTVGEVFNGCRDNGPDSYEYKGKTLTNGDEIADAFAGFFESKVCNLMANSKVMDVPEIESQNNEWSPFTEEEIKKALGLLKNKRSCGPDEIPMSFVKDCNEILAPHLTRIFNYMVSTTWFPEEWKLAKIVPIHKKGKRDLVENFRPVSNLCTLSKVLERCLLARMSQYELDDHSQHGFRGGHGTVTAALEVQHHIASMLDKREKVAVYSLDMSAAFDLLRPALLLPKMKAMDCNVVNLVMNFLSNRCAYVNIKGENSRLIKIPAGVPQGSVLGPKLFSIYTRGLEEVITEEYGVQLVVYADDSYVICSSSTLPKLKTLVESTLEKHIEWLRLHGMVVNSSKTELLMMGNESLEVIVDGARLVSKKTLRVLGLEFDDQLSWQNQIQRSISSCQSMKPSLRRLRSKLKDSELLQVISSHYFARLYYGSEVWFPCSSAKHKKMIASAHYYALRLVVKDFKSKMSRDQINRITKRASPQELMDFKISKLLISVCNNSEPFALFSDLLLHVLPERRSDSRPKFVDMSTLKIGKQSFSNRLSCTRKIKFNWYGLNLSPHTIRTELKKSFFSYA